MCVFRSDPNLFEGDIVLDPDQRLAIEHGSNAMAATAGKIWPVYVPYEIETKLSKFMFSCFLIIALIIILFCFHISTFLDTFSLSLYNHFFAINKL